MPKVCADPACDKQAKGRGSWCGPCERKRYPEDPIKRRASWRAKNHRRRSRCRATFDEVTPEQERGLRAKAKRCPLCNVRLTDTPYLPASKELDHIMPKNAEVGGTHTIGNVRIICRLCNSRRPRDGSDYTGPVTLWAQLPGFVKQAKVKREPKPKPPRMVPTCGCGAVLTRGTCRACHPLHPPRYVPAKHLTHEQQRERQAKAVVMRDQGRTWWDIADTLGYGRESSAFAAVRTWREANDVTQSDVA